VRGRRKIDEDILGRKGRGRRGEERTEEENRK
jgi:hypothetical protein